MSQSKSVPHLFLFNNYNKGFSFKFDEPVYWGEDWVSVTLIFHLRNFSFFKGLPVLVKNIDDGTTHTKAFDIFLYLNQVGYVWNTYNSIFHFRFLMVFLQRL